MQAMRDAADDNSMTKRANVSFYDMILQQPYLFIIPWLVGFRSVSTLWLALQIKIKVYL